MDRLAYLVRRLLLVIPTFLGITFVCFMLTWILPGGPVEIRLMRMKGLSAQGGGTGEGAGADVSHVTEEYRQQLEKQFGFDRPFYEQYWKWLVVNRMGLNLKSYDFGILCIDYHEIDLGIATVISKVISRPHYRHFLRDSSVC